MSHELRTPLTSVIGLSSVLKEQIFGSLNKKQEQYVNIISTCGYQLLDLIMITSI
jgi:signal transduction histidine kinase